MRWMWIDRVVDFEPETRLVAVKDVDAALDNQRTNIPRMNDHGRMDVLPMPLVVEGMAQTAGILVGSVNRFREKVVLAKISKVEFDEEAVPGQTIRYAAEIERMDDVGASTRGVVSRLDHREGAWRDIGRIDLMFSHIDNNMAGQDFPEHNFVFSENFHSLLRLSGMDSFIDS